MKLKKLMKRVAINEIVRITDNKGRMSVESKTFYTNHFKEDDKIDVVYVDINGILTVHVR